MYDVYKNTKNHEPIVLAIFNEAGDILAITNALVIQEIRGPLGIFTARSVIQGGPLWVDEKDGLKAVQLLMNSYDKIAQKKGLYTEIRMFSEFPELNPIISNCGYVFEEHFNALINLTNISIEDLWEKIKRDKKRGIKKGEQMGIVIEECTKKEDIRIVYELIKETYENARVPLADKTLFEAAFNILVPKKKAVFLFANYKGERIATQVALMDQKTIYAWYTGAKRNYLSFHPGDLLIWHLLKWGVENGYSVFDFGGGGTKEKNVNLREYKARFGTEFPEYGRYKKVYSPIKLKIAEIGFEVYKRILCSKKVS